MSKKENKKTVFRYINGRLVPITIGAGSIGVGHVIGNEKLFEKHILSKIRKETSRSRFMTPGHYTTGSISNKLTRTLENKYFYKIKKAGVHDVISDHPSILPWTRRTSLLQTADPSEGLKLRILVPDKSRIGFLHELGHAENLTNNSKTYNLALKGRKIVHENVIKDVDSDWLRKIIIKSRPNTFKRKILASKSYEKIRKFTFKQERAFGYAMQLPEEASAWIKGAKHLSTYKRKKIMLKSAIKPFMTYAAFPLQQGLRLTAFATGLGLIGYGLFKKGKK
jgi:hypothetical protein